MLCVRYRLSSSAAALLSSAGSTSLSVFVSGRPWALSSILILVANSRRHSERSNSSSSAAKDFPRLDQRNRIRHQCQYCRHPVPSPFGLSSVQKCRLTRPNRRCLPVSVGCRCSEAAHAHVSDVRRQVSVLSSVLGAKLGADQLSELSYSHRTPIREVTPIGSFRQLSN